MQHAYEAAKLLAEILDEFNADSFLFQVAQPELPDNHSELDLTVRTIGPSIYGDVYS